MAAKAKGILVPGTSSWFGRYWATVDGERKRLFVSLETQNELIARKKLDALVAGETSSKVQDETFEEAAHRVHQIRARTLSSAKIELGFLRKHAFRAIGRMSVVAIGKKDVVSVLEAVRDDTYSDQTILHVRNAIAAVFKQLRREGVIETLPLPSADELPECLPDAIDDRPKAILSDDELLVYLAFTDAREGERYRGGVRERQMMALLSRCVGGMRTGELHGLTWARAQVEGERFDQLEVIRYKSRRKGARRGSKAPVRQLFPLGDTVLPAFLRYWWIRSGRPPMDALLFPVRRAKRLEANDKGAAINHTGGRREKATWAKALRRDVQRAFEAALEQNAQNVPTRSSRRWAELFAGTDDRRPLWFHTTRNMAAVAAERNERLNNASRFTGHASARMLQHYREMVGEVDVVPVVPQLLPDGAALLSVLRAWCKAEKIDVSLVLREPVSDGAEPRGREPESPRITATQELSYEAKSPVKTACAPSVDGIPKLAHYQAVLHPEGRAL